MVGSVPESVEKDWEKHPERKQEMLFFPNFFLRELIGWYAALAVVIALAVFLPSELGTKADPFSPAPPGIKPEWYFLAQFQTLKLIPAHILSLDGELLGILGFGLGGAAWLGLPFIEDFVGARRVRWVKVGIIFVMIYLASMSVLGYVSR